MIITNEKLKSNIECVFGEYGERWIEELPDKIELCLRKWNLEIIEEVKNLSFNYVSICKSKKYGEVLLKICPSEGNYNQEFVATKLLDSSKIRECLEFDEKINALLLQLLTPGDILHSLNNTKNEISIGTDLIKSIPRKVPEAKIELPTYYELLEKAFSYVIERNLGGEELKSFIESTRLFQSQLEERYEAEYICHGDFHHENIIFDEIRGWIVIDPKGFIGFWFSDIGRYILNHLGKVPLENRDWELENIIYLASENLKLPKEDVFKASFIETVLCYCWHYQGDYTEEGYKNLKGKMLNDILPYINSDLFKNLI